MQQRFVQLTEDNMTNGLSKRDFVDYSGNDIAFVDIESLPYWDKVKNNCGLTQFEIDARFAACLAAFADQGMNIRNTAYSSENSKLIASAKLGIILDPQKKTAVPHQTATEVERHFIKMLGGASVNNIFDIVYIPTVEWSDVDPSFVPFTSPYSYTEAARPLPQLFRRAASAYCRRMTLPAPSALWEELTGMSSEKLVCMPKENYAQTLIDLHELRHTIQVRPNPNETSDFTAFYRELDADIFARESFKRISPQFPIQETLTAHLHSRYLGMMSTFPAYWIGPALEAVGSGSSAPDYQSVISSHTELLARMGSEARGPNLSAFSSKDLKGFMQPAGPKSTLPLVIRSESPVVNQALNSYEFWKLTTIHQCPELFFSLLREILYRGDITDGLSRHIASRIVNAAEYFGGKEMTHVPRLRRKIEETMPHIS